MLLLDNERPLLPLLPQGGAAGGIAWSACRGWSEEARGCAPPRLVRVRVRVRVRVGARVPEAVRRRASNAI